MLTQTIEKGIDTGKLCEALRVAGIISNVYSDGKKTQIDLLDDNADTAKAKEIIDTF